MRRFTVRTSRGVGREEAGTQYPNRLAGSWKFDMMQCSMVGSRLILNSYPFTHQTDQTDEIDTTSRHRS